MKTVVILRLKLRGDLFYFFKMKIKQTQKWQNSLLNLKYATNTLYFTCWLSKTNL